MKNRRIESERSNPTGQAGGPEAAKRIVLRLEAEMSRSLSNLRLRDSAHIVSYSFKELVRFRTRSEVNSSRVLSGRCKCMRR